MDFTVYSWWKLGMKPNSWTYNFVEVSRLNLQSSQTWGFRIQCSHYEPVSNYFWNRQWTRNGFDINTLDGSRQWTSQLIWYQHFGLVQAMDSQLTFWTGPGNWPHNWFDYQHFGLVQAVDLLQSRAGCCGNYEPKDWGSTDWGRGHQVPVLVYSIFKTAFLADLLISSFPMKIPLIKGTVSRDFLLQVFFMNHLRPSPW